tara:strand:- start:1244 stop:2722 length:1479 start_codon:yes stop_codon:yes gene_type:complete
MEFVINEVTYSLPCRSFVIDYAVSEKRKLAVVKEFTIRLLYSLKGITPEKIASYFGFTADETQVVLASLQEERLIKWDDGSVELTTYAYDRFEEVNGKAEPRFFEVEDKIDSVTFDLLSYKLVAESSSGSVSPNNMEIPLPQDAMEKLTEKAKAAFDQQFNTFIEKAKGIDTYTEAVELYKINQVYNRNDRLLPVRIKYIVTTENCHTPSIKYIDEWMEDWDDDRSLFSCICSQTESTGFGQTNLNISLDEYITLTKDPIILNFYQNENFDFHSALKAYESNKGIFELETRMLVGNIYSTQNQDLIQSLLDYKLGDGAKIPSKGVLWSVDPSDKVWGRGPEIESFIQSIEQRLDDRKRPVGTVLAVNVQSKQDTFRLKDLYGITKCHFQGLNKYIGNGQIEIFLIPGVLVACTFHFLIENHYPLSLPIGFVTTDHKRIESIEKYLIEIFDNPANVNNYFERFDVEDDKTVLHNKVIPLFSNHIANTKNTRNI